MTPKSNLKEGNYEMLSPHKIVLTILIREYFNTNAKEGEEEEMEWLPKYRKRFCILLLKLIQYPDMSYKQLHDHLKSTHGLHPTHLANFEKVMGEFVSKDVDAVYELGKTLDYLVVPDGAKSAPVGQYGIVGLYLRRVLVTIDYLSLIELMHLYQSICDYYNKSIRAIVLTTGDVTEMVDLDLELDQNIDSNRGFRRWTKRQMDLFVVKQYMHLGNNDNKILSPIKLRELLNEIVEDNPNYSPAYFLMYLNSVRVRDYFCSVDDLHRSFDLKNFTGRRGYQYLSLNKAMLHAKFGHVQAAMNGLKEAIMLAQEAGDHDCLQFAEGWLNYLNPNNAHLGKENQTSLKYNHSSNLQLYSKAAAISGHDLKNVQEIITQSDFLNCQNSLIPQSANSSSLKSAILAQYGRFELSSINSQVLLSVNLRTFRTTFNGEAICHALSNIAVWISLQGEYSKSAVILQYAKENFPDNPWSRIWMLADQQIVINQSIYNRNWQDGLDACERMKSADEEKSQFNLATLYFARGNYNCALKIVNELLSQNQCPLLEVKTLLLKTQIFISSPGNTSEAFNQAINILIKAKELNFHYEISICESLVAHLLLELGMPEQAMKHARQALCKILENGTLYDRAKIQFQFVKCLLATVPDKDKAQVMKEDCMPILKEAVDSFNILQTHWKVKQVYVFIAEFYHKLGMNTERNNFAYRFRRLEEEFPSPYEFVDGIF